MKIMPFIVGFALLLVTVYAFSDSDLDRMDNSMFENPRRPGSIFSHDDHNETAGIDDCAVCHHVYDGKKRVEDESSEDSPCSECHFFKKNKENSVPLRAAYHRRCKSCHFESNKGPVLCGECHIKK